MFAVVNGDGQVEADAGAEVLLRLVLEAGQVAGVGEDVELWFVAIVDDRALVEVFEAVDGELAVEFRAVGVWDDGQLELGVGQGCRRGS